MYAIKSEVLSKFGMHLRTTYPHAIIQKFNCCQRRNHGGGETASGHPKPQWIWTVVHLFQISDMTCICYNKSRKFLLLYRIHWNSGLVLINRWVWDRKQRYIKQANYRELRNCTTHTIYPSNSHCLVLKAKFSIRFKRSRLSHCRVTPQDWRKTLPFLRPLGRLTCDGRNTKSTHDSHTK